MLSQDDEKKINEKMRHIADKYLVLEILNADENRISVENVATVIAYKQTENLVTLSNNLIGSTDKLKCWTIVIATFTIILGISTIWSIVDKLLNLM